MRATDIIRDEHRSLAAVLHGLRYVASEIQVGRIPPDFELLDTMLRYIEGVPELLHHPKEDAFLFPAVRRCAPEIAGVIDELERQHVQGRKLLAQLRYALEEFRSHGVDGARAFAEAIEIYAEFHWRHMRIEEDQILPVADSKLTTEDNAQIDAAFAANREPVGRGSESQEFRELFRRIAHLAPAPIGVGPDSTPPSKR